MRTIAEMARDERHENLIVRLALREAGPISKEIAEQRYAAFRRRLLKVA